MTDAPATLRRPVLLVLRVGGLGRLLTILPALRGLRRSQPYHRLLLATPRRFADLAELLPEVDEFLPLEPLGPLPPWTQRPDMAINFHDEGPRSHEILQALEPHRLLAYRCDEIGHGDGPSWDAEEHDVRRWCRLLAHAGIDADPSDLLLDGAIRRHRIPRLTVIHPEATRPSQRWPLERWAEVARSERQAGRRVVLAGTSGELASSRRIAELAGLGKRSVAAGRTDLLGLIRLVASAERIVCPQTGIAALAPALATPSVVLCGAERPTRCGPPGRPGGRQTVVLGTNPGPDPAEGLAGIEVADVLVAIAALETTGEAVDP